MQASSPSSSMPKKTRSKKPSQKKKAHAKVKKLKRIAKKAVKKVRKPRKVKAKKARPSKVKKAVKKPSKAAAPKKISASRKKMVAAIAENVIGKVTHYYDRIGVAVVAVESPIRVGDTVRLKHGDAAFEQKVQSLQVDHTPIAVANAGQEVGMKVDQLATEGTLLIKP